MRAIAAAVLLFSTSSLLAVTEPRIDRVEPFRLKVQSAGTSTIEVLGEYPFLKGGHEDMDQYEHWFIRRAGEGDWEMCTRLSTSCKTSGWRAGMQSLELNASRWLSRPGTLEIRMNEGLSETGHSDWPFSNIVQVPVLDAFGAPPQIVSLSKKEFVSGGAEGDFVFRIAANNFDEESAMVIFRGDTYVRPIRVIDGSQIEVAVPPNYRNADGELSLTLRTTRGGESAPQYFKVLKPKTTATIGTLQTTRIQKPINPSRVVTVNPGALKVSPDVTLANRVQQALVTALGADAAAAISVSATSGVVKLTGAVTREQRSAAAAAATNVSGVTRVANELTIK
jgi:hypothetical protein